MNNYSEIHIIDSGKITLSTDALEALKAKSGDTFEILADEKQDKIFISPKRPKLSNLKGYGFVVLDEESSIELPQLLAEEMDLCKAQELSLIVDLELNCIVLTPIPPYCVFCGELGDIKLHGKHICADCVDEIASCCRKAV